MMPIVNKPKHGKAKLFAKSEFSATDETRFSVRRARGERVVELVDASRRERGIRPDENRYVPIKGGAA